MWHFLIDDNEAASNPEKKAPYIEPPQTPTPTIVQGDSRGDASARSKDSSAPGNGASSAPEPLPLTHVDHSGRASMVDVSGVRDRC